MAVAPAFVIRLLQRSREHDPQLGVLRKELDAALAARGQTLEDAIRADGRRQATEQAFMSSLVGSLRLVGTFDWTEYFEDVSLVEQVLRRDPVGIYARMDFQSRDRYRHAVEEMATRTGDAQLRVALKAVERARQVAEHSPADQRAHVGFYLIGTGRRAFEQGLDGNTRRARAVSSPARTLPVAQSGEAAKPRPRLARAASAARTVAAQAVAVPSRARTRSAATGLRDDPATTT